MELHELINNDVEQPERAILQYLEHSSVLCACLDELHFWALIENVAKNKKENIAKEYRESLQNVE
jgi:hypothetical protein